MCSQRVRVSEWVQVNMCIIVVLMRDEIVYVHIEFYRLLWKCLCHEVIIAHDLHTHILRYFSIMYICTTPRSKNITTKCKNPLWFACIHADGEVIFSICISRVLLAQPWEYDSHHSFSFSFISVFSQQQRNGNQIKLKTLIQ